MGLSEERRFIAITSAKADSSWCQMICVELVWSVKNVDIVFWALSLVDGATTEEAIVDAVTTVDNVANKYINKHT